MKALRFMLFVALLSACSLAFAQSDAQKSFDSLKTLTGTWKGTVTTDMPQGNTKDAIDNQPMYVTFRVTSKGNTLVHEMKKPGTPDDPKKDDPLTLFYLDGDRLLLTHYCDAGNRPRMIGKPSADGKSVEFEFLDIAGNTKYGHMHHGAFTIIDANHHTEDWTFMVGDKPVHGHLDLQRVQQ